MLADIRQMKVPPAYPDGILPDDSGVLQRWKRSDARQSLFDWLMIPSRPENRSVNGLLDKAIANA